MSLPAVINYRYLLEKAWPIILANAAVPLLGLIDTAVIGNVGAVEDLGAIALGSLVFLFVYWGFGFLRMGTTGFVAQANGAGNELEVRSTLGRALILAITLGLLLIGLQYPIGYLAFNLMSASDSVESVAKIYFSIRIWGAPATLSTFALMGLLVGLGLSRHLLVVQLFLNILNIVLDVVFAGVMGWGVAGIALGTVLAEWTTVIFAGWIIWQHLDKRNINRELFWQRHHVFNKSRLLTMMSANTDIMIRTLLLVFSFAWFTNQSALYGNVVLAANYILLQLISFSAFFLDGYAFVVESLVGSAIGAKNRLSFDTAVYRSSVLALVTACFLASAIYLFGDVAVMLLTDIEEIRIAASEMLYLAVVYVICAFAAFQLDGIFIGASFTREMRNASAISFVIFIISWWLLADNYGVVGLWWAFILYVCARSGALMIYYKTLRQSIDVN